MKALVLAAGMGERLRPLTDVTPKPMLELGGRPLIHYPLAMLRRGGVTEVAINVHHLESAVRRGLGDGSGLGLRITYCLLYTSDAADDLLCVDLGGRRI